MPPYPQHQSYLKAWPRTWHNASMAVFIWSNVLKPQVFRVLLPLYLNFRRNYLIQDFAYKS